MDVQILQALVPLEREGGNEAGPLLLQGVPPEWKAMNLGTRMDEEIAGTTDSKGGGDEDGADILRNIHNATNHDGVAELMQGLEDSLDPPEDHGEDDDYKADEEDDEDEDFIVASHNSASSSSRKRRQPPSRKTSGATKKKQATKKKVPPSSSSVRTTKRRKSNDLDDQGHGDDDDFVDKPQDNNNNNPEDGDREAATSVAATAANGRQSRPKGPRTCGGRGPAVGRLPALWREVLRRLPPVPPDADGYEGLPYDPDVIQRLVIDLALDPSLHGCPAGGGGGDDDDSNSETDAERRVVAEAIHRVTASTNEGGRRYRLPQRDGCDRKAVLALYEAFLSTPKQLKKRSYRMEGAPDLRSLWTEERIARFQLAFRKYGYGPTSNRKIAEAIGEGIHANHVADFKRRYKKVLIKEGRIDELKSISGIRMKKIEQKMSQLRDKQQRKTKQGRRTPAASKRTAAAIAAEVDAGPPVAHPAEAIPVPGDVDVLAPA